MTADRKSHRYRLLEVIREETGICTMIKRLSTHSQEKWKHKNDQKAYIIYRGHEIQPMKIEMCRDIEMMR